jgi:peptidyl-dipeptidase A
MLKYQGLVPPGPRPADAFDPGAKYHVAANTPYTRYFLARSTSSSSSGRPAAGRLDRAAAPLLDLWRQGGGQRFNAMLEMGQSKPWPEAMQAFTGETGNDARPSPTISRR